MYYYYKDLLEQSNRIAAIVDFWRGQLLDDEQQSASYKWEEFWLMDTVVTGESISDNIPVTQPAGSIG